MHGAYCQIFDSSTDGCAILPGMGGANSLSRRERQILEAVVRLRRATVNEVRDQLDDPPSYSAVRTTMGILVDKGHLQFQKDGRRYVYAPAQSPARLRRSALRDVLHNFFDDSVEQVVDTLLDAKSRKLDDEQLDRIAALVQRAKERRK